MFDKHALLCVARDANFVPLGESDVGFHAAAIAHVNGIVAEAALTRVSIDAPPQGYDVLRMRYVRADDAPR